MDKDGMSSFIADIAENFADNLWKVFPFRAGNRMWGWVLVKAYGSLIVLSFVLACMLNAMEGKAWTSGGYDDKHLAKRGNGFGNNSDIVAKGKTALDECFWFIICTVHGAGFGEFNAQGTPGRLLGGVCVCIGYWFPIFLMTIVMISQLPGEKAPTVLGCLGRLVSAVWPSYILLLALTFVAGYSIGPYISPDGWTHHDVDGRNYGITGVYFLWQIIHRMPYGDVWPDTPWGRMVTMPAGIIGTLYMPYALALVAVRSPSLAQQESLLSDIRTHPEDAFGRGYIVPKGAEGGFGGAREMVMQEYQPSENNI